MNPLARLEAAIGYSFSDSGLLQLALTHRSAGARNNERLEFLGDSIVNHVIAQALYERFPDCREGDLSRLRASLVKGDTLAAVAQELELGQYLQLGTGERKSGGHRRGSILADALEAVAGAILLDAGYAQCRDCLLAWFQQRLADVSPDSTGKDAKTRLQEYLQGRAKPLPEYHLEAVEGKDHRQRFRVSCRLRDPEIHTEAIATSRRKAEQGAAQLALEALG